MDIAVVVRRGLVIAGMLALSGPSMAGAENITVGELALTPAFCQDVQAIPITGWTKTSPSPRAPKWIAIMGETFWAMHHHCWALVGLQRAERAGTSPQEREWRIRDAIDDFNFVVKNAPEDFILLPEIHYRLGSSYLLLGDYGSALSSFAKSRSLKRDYWPAYVGEANLLLKAGRREEAQALLGEGLKLLPNEPNLLAAMNRARGTSRTAGRQKRD